MNRIGLLVSPLAWYVISALLAMQSAKPKKIEISNGLEKERSGLVQIHETVSAFLYLFFLAGEYIRS